MKKSIYQLSAFLFSTALLLSMVGIVSSATAQSVQVEKTCKDIEGYSENLTNNSSGSWGSIAFAPDSGPLVLNVNEDYTVNLCVKKGSSVGNSQYPGPIDLGGFVGPITDKDVYYPETSGVTGFSHYAYNYEYTPEVPGTYFKFAKVWEGDEIDLEGVKVVFTYGENEWELGDKPVMVKPGQVIEPLSEQVTGLPENCTYESNMPPSYTIPGGYTEEEASRTKEVSKLYTLDVTNTVTCEDEEEETPPAVLAAVTPTPQVAVKPVGAADAGGAGTTALVGLVGSTLAVSLGAVIRKFSL
jgi:hypothetical protein